MGLFSSKKITYVSSVAYNMAGDEAERPSYIKSLVIQNITSDTSDSMATTLRYGYLGGPQMDFRAFYRWARDHYKAVGMPDARINGFENVNEEVVRNQLPPLAGWTPYLQNAEVVGADYTSWAEQYILDNRPQDFSTAWKSFMLETGQIYIEFADSTTALFWPNDFNRDSTYLYILYNYIKENSTEATVTGPVITVPPGGGFPSTTGWAVDYNNVVPTTVPLNTVVTTEVSYSDGSPTETTEETSSTTQSYSNRNSHYYRSDYIGQDPNSSNPRLINRRSDRYFMSSHTVTQTTVVEETEEEEDGVTITTKVTTVTDVLNISRTYRTDTTDTVVSEWGSQRLWLYRIGSGQNGALEAMIANPTRIEGEFMPAMPVRLENRFIASDYYTEVYDQTVKGYKKLMGKKFSELVEKVNDNPNLGDIDFAFLVFGVSLNVKEVACKKYLYKFFKKIMATQQYGQGALDAFVAEINRYNAWVEEIKLYYEGNGPYPGWMTMPNLFTNEIQVKSRGQQDIPYDIRLSWVSISETFANGQGKAGAKKGDLWFETLPNQTWARAYMHNNGEGALSIRYADSFELEKIRLYFQVTNDTYSYLEIYGLKHINYVYNGKFVEITAREALEDQDESGFIVPMHYATMKEMSLVDSTQMSTANVFIVFNCYQIVKQKWYQRGIFKILFVVVFAIVSAVFTGGAGFGILGANLAVGSAMGFTGLTAAIAGSVANALAAVILTQVIGYASTALFGEKFGALIGAIISFVVFNVAATFQQTGMMGINWGSMMRAENLLKLTDALSQGYQGYMNGVTQGIIGNTQNLMTSYNTQSEDIQQMWNKNIGYADYAFNPSWITSSTTYSYEGSSTFLQRTLMTGMDIAQMSHDMLTDYTTLNLTLPSVYG